MIEAIQVEYRQGIAQVALNRLFRPGRRCGAAREKQQGGGGDAGHRSTKRRLHHATTGAWSYAPTHYGAWPRSKPSSVALYEAEGAGLQATRILQFHRRYQAAAGGCGRTTGDGVHALTKTGARTAKLVCAGG